jgi:KaiC/GvpD/RAD55 family RecA-like ATPase
MSLAIEPWIHPKARNRIVLDYPLDVLLNRECRLRDYEQGAVSSLREYNTRVYEYLSKAWQAGESNKLAYDVVSAWLRRKTQVLSAVEGLGSPNNKVPENASELLETATMSLWKPLTDAWEKVRSICDGQIGALQLSLDEDVLPVEEARLTFNAGGLLDWKENHFRKTMGQAADSTPCGSGNILIRGRPGAGKSTLALQMAVTSTWRPNHYAALFFALEESREQILGKAQSMNWGKKLRTLNYLDNVEDAAPVEKLGEALRHALTQPPRCCIRWSATKSEPPSTPCEEHEKGVAKGRCEPLVLLPRLSPGGIGAPKGAAASLFWERYRQLERILGAAQWLRQQPPHQGMGVPDIRMVCIDGLNALAPDLPSRDEIAKLFDLFRRMGVIGVVTAEGAVGDASDESRDEAGYLADIVIDLAMEQDRGYAVRYLEIRKSRYQHEVYGKHFVRLRGSEIYGDHRTRWESDGDITTGLVQALDKEGAGDPEKERGLIEEHLSKLTVAGPEHTFGGRNNE